MLRERLLPLQELYVLGKSLELHRRTTKLCLVEDLEKLHRLRGRILSRLPLRNS